MDPIVLFFILGLAAGLARSDLRLPRAIYEFLSVVLLLTIALKAGVELAQQSPAVLLPQIVAVMIMGGLLPLAAYPLLRFARRLSSVDSAAIAAHYGSVSVGTYAVAVAWLVSRNISFEEHMPPLLVTLEVPAIVVGIMLARGAAAGTDWKRLGHEVFLGKSIVLLIGGLLIGWAAGQPAAPRPVPGGLRATHHRRYPAPGRARLHGQRRSWRRQPRHAQRRLGGQQQHPHRGDL